MAREISIRLSVEDADRVKAVLQSVGATGEQAFAAFERGATAGAQSFSRLERSLDPVVAGQQRFAAAQAGINRALESGLASQERASQLLELARRRYLELDDASGKAAGGTSRLGQVVGQAGFQLQDFVVQVGSGQNALVALAQQGSQLLGVFGGFGAVAGAGLAILAVAANMAIGKTAAEKLSEELDRQQSEFEAAAKRAQDYQNALRAQGDRYRAAAEAGQRYREGLRGEGDTLIELTRYYQGLTEARLGYERAQFSTTTRANAINTLSLQREVNRTLNRPLTQAAPAGAGLEAIAGIGGGGLPPSSQPDYQQATAAIARFRAENKLTEEAVLQLRQALQGAVELNGSYAASINAMLIGLDALIPQLERLSEAQRRANVRQLAMSGQASPEQLRALADQASREVGGVYQQRQRIQELRSDLRGGLPGADPQQAAAIRSSLQALAAQEEGLTPATTQLLRGLQDQARLANVAAGAARELAASDIALDNAARQAGLGQASLADKTEARRLVQRRLDGELMDSLLALNRQITGAEDLAAAQRQGAAAVREVEARIRAETEALKYAEEHTEQYQRLVAVLSTRYQDLAEKQALARSNAAELSQQQQLEQLRAEQQLVGATIQVRERELAVLRERQKLVSEGMLGTEAAARRLALAGQIADETQALKRQQDAWTELSNVGVQAFDRIGQAITTALANGQLSTIRFGNIAKAVMAEVVQYFAKVALVNPVLNAVFGTSRTTLGDLGGIVGSIFGDGGGTAAASAVSAGTLMIDGIPAAAYQALPEGVSGPVLSIPAGATYSVSGSVAGLSGFGGGRSTISAAASGGLLGNLGMLSSGASILNQLSGGSLYGGIVRYLGLSGEGGLFSSLSNGVSEFLATPLFVSGDLAGATNSALAAMPAAMYGPATPEAVAAAGANVGTLGQVAGGAAGVLGGAYGIYSGIQKGGIGGGFQVAGGAVTAAAGISSLLASAGIISASLGPIGWIAGAVLAIVGALLPGQKPSNREGNATYDFVTGQLIQDGATGKKFSQANRDAAASMVGGVVDAAARLEKTLGLSFSQRFRIGVGDRDGIYYTINNGPYSRYGRDDQGAKDLARDLIHALTVQSAGNLSAAALRIPLQSGVKWDTLENALQQIQQLVEVTNGAKPSAAQNIAAGNINWADFGNGIADLKWVKDVYEVLIQDNSPAAKFARQLQTINDQFDAAAEKARELGLSEAAVNAARAKQIQGAYDQRDLAGLKLIQSQQATLTDFLDSVTYASASPAGRLQLAQDAFGKALDAARGKDVRTADLGAVTKAASTLLSAGQDYYASSSGAAELERFVRSSIESLGAQLQLPAFGGDLEASLSAAVNPLKDELELLRNEVAALREELRTSRLRLAA